jgi:hypothetical protein
MKASDGYVRKNLTLPVTEVSTKKLLEGRLLLFFSVVWSHYPVST